MPDLLIKGDAVYSPSEVYRYSLTRTWDDRLPRVCFIMLNPSTATADVDDATTRRILRMAQEWGYGSYEAVNLFAFRATSPKRLKEVPDPVGEHNDAAILTAAGRADLIVAAWGTQGGYLARDLDVRILLKNIRIWCLRVTRNGHPGHPLYLPNGLKPIQLPGSESDG